MTSGKGVTSIGEKAFYKCAKLTTLTVKSAKLKKKEKIFFYSDVHQCGCAGHIIHRVLFSGQVKDLTSRGYTILMAIHQPDQAFLFADEVLALKDGCLIAQGTPREVITREFIKSLYKTDVQIESLADDRMRVCVPMVLLRGDR